MRVNVGVRAVMGVLIAEIAGGSEAAFQDHLQRKLARLVPSAKAVVLKLRRIRVY